MATKVEPKVEEVVAKAEPVKEKETPKEEKKEEKETKEMSALDKSFETLKGLVVKAKGGQMDTDAINRAFAEIGTTVEREVAPAPKPVDVNDIAAIIKSAVAEAMTPMNVRLAQVEAKLGNGVPANSGGVVKSKALSLNPGGVRPEELVQRAGIPSGPVRKLSQIEKLSRRSTGLPES